MCRIAGIIAANQPLPEAEQQVRMMCNAMQHGGPDDEGIFTDQHARLIFGHRRLSIIDLSATGHQPMANGQQRAWITFNGEIYNYRELKNELLETGAGFYTHTDTEVILVAYNVWGVLAFQKLRGMFAFALYDKTTATTYLVRDTAGIKPLYYHIAGGQLSFASEVKAFKQAGIATQPDTGWQVRFLAFGHIPEPYTTLKDVYQLARGNYLQWNNNDGTYAIKSYKRMNRGAKILLHDDATATIADMLKQAVDRQLVADATIGVFLSGGIDSSILTLLANAIKGDKLNTVSVYFNDKTVDERAYQHQVSAQIMGDKFTHLVNESDFETNFAAIKNAMDLPTTDGINTWFISKFARQDGLKAVLSGLGADELFGGYPSFTRIQHIRQLKMLPKMLLKLAGFSPVGKFKKIAFLGYDGPAADYLFLRGFFTPEEIAVILDTDVRQVANILFGDEHQDYPRSYNAEHAAWLETNMYMQNQLLRDTDVMSMSHGLEVRVPFLDEDLQAAVDSISPLVRFDNIQPKKILIDSFKDILPQSVWNRPKMGFSFPLQQWMANHQEISDPGFYTGKHVRDLITEFKPGRLHWSKAYALYQLQNA